MSPPCFLLDEHVPVFIQARPERMESELRVYAIGDGIAPPKGTSGLDILIWIEAHGCILVMSNRSTFAWSDNGTHVVGLTPCGRATISALRLNRPLVVAARAVWVSVGRHPPDG